MGAHGEPEDDDATWLAAGEIDEWDSPADVQATFRTQRRVAVGYFAIFVVVTVAVPVLALWLPWWTEARIVGGMSPAFLMAAVGLYLFFLVLGVLASTLADSVEDRMLGVHDTGDPP